MATIRIERQWFDLQQHLGAEPAELAVRHAWLVKARWVAAAAMAVGGWLGASGGLIEDWRPMAAIAAAVAIANALFVAAGRRVAEAARSVDWQRLLAGQFALDAGLWLAALHFAGTVTNPLIAVGVFQMVLAGLTLPLGWALALATAQAAGLAAVLAGEAAGWLGHHPLGVVAEISAGSGAWRASGFVAAWAVGVWLASTGVVCFVQQLVAHVRRSEAARAEAIRRAAELDRLARVGAVAAGVAHTIRNPLHGIMGCVDLLQAGQCRAPRDAEVMELLADGIAKINAVTNGLLALAEPATAAPEAADAGVIAQDAVELSQPRAQGKRVALSLQCPAQVPRLQVGADRLTAVVAGIIDNGIDACACGGRVAISVELAGANTVRISISDDGCGIDEADLPRVCEPFFSTKPVGDGAGLGLAIARQVVEDYGGVLTVTSAKQTGTTVHIDLPKGHDS